MANAALSFDHLRTWDGEQSRAFEEISFQLMKDKLPPHTRAVRTGNPDGGVDWYATLPDGNELGWQAKYIDRIDALLTAMTDSVRRVAEERPKLRKLTFVISTNLATGKGGRTVKSQWDKYQDKIVFWQQNICGADKIVFDLVQASDLLDELAKPEHQGRRWFWWDQVVFGSDWLAANYHEQADAAGERYRPDLQVDIPIQEDFLALGFAHSAQATFNRLLRTVMSAAADADASLGEAGAADGARYQDVQREARELKVTAGELTVQAGDSPAALGPLLAQMSACRESVRDAERHEHERGLQTTYYPRHGFELRQLAVAVEALTVWLDTFEGRSFRQRAYFLIGHAGAGKTHLLLDATRRALDAGRPAVFLAGARLGHGSMWGSITDQLGLRAVGADELLQAMDSAGEAASASGSRFMIFIDALNETTPTSFWRVHLPALRAKVAQYPHVALVASCRDTYQDLVMDDAEGLHYIRRAHPGFAGHEVEAAHKYFAHFGITAPRFPLLIPEFTLPLFLRMYCESYKGPGAGPGPDGHQGRVAIFEQYLVRKTDAVAYRLLAPDAASGWELDEAQASVRRVLDKLLDELSRTSQEGIGIKAAESVAQRALDGLRDRAMRILGLLQEEGILTRERLYLGSDDPGEHCP